VDRRRRERFHTTSDLATVIAAVKGHRRSAKTHPATQVFQALRIEVNQELADLDHFLSSVIDWLNPGCRLVVISFHSLEDRIVKKTLQLEAGRCICFKPGDHCTCPKIQRVKILTRKPVRPGQEELEHNPSSRSAKLRAIERLASQSKDRALEKDQKYHGGFK
jgi:16S rRNA (cytosine1402-N4)-methyltransferase